MYRRTGMSTPGSSDRDHRDRDRDHRDHHRDRDRDHEKRVVDSYLSEAEVYHEKVIQTQLKKMSEFDKSPIARINKGEFVPSIFVSNLGRLKEVDIVKRFESFGPVRGFDWGVPLNNACPFGFVYFERKDTVDKILRSHIVMQGIHINGTKVKVQDGEPKLEIHSQKLYQSKFYEAKRQNKNIVREVKLKPQTLPGPPEPTPRSCFARTPAQSVRSIHMLKTDPNSLDPRLRPRVTTPPPAPPPAVGVSGNTSINNKDDKPGHVQSSTSSTLESTATTTKLIRASNIETKEIPMDKIKSQASKPVSVIKDGFLKFSNLKYGPPASSTLKDSVQSEIIQTTSTSTKLKSEDDTKANKSKSVTNVSIYSTSSTPTGSLVSSPSPTKPKFKESSRKKSETKKAKSPAGPLSPPITTSLSLPYPQHPEFFSLPIMDKEPVVNGEPKIRRSLFFYGIGSGNRTNQIAIFKQYFSHFGLLCEINISADKLDTSNGYGYCVFEKSSAVDKIQSARPHRLDGYLFYTKRTIHLDKAFLKEATKTTESSHNQIFIYGMSEVSAVEELTNFFSAYGKIIDIYLSPNVDLQFGGHALLTFEDSDSVDHVVLLPQPTLDGRVIIIHKIWSKLEAEYAKGNYKQFIKSIHDSKNVVESPITIPTPKVSPGNEKLLNVGPADSKSISQLPQKTPVQIITIPDDYPQSSSTFGPIRTGLPSNRINPYPVSVPNLPKLPVPPSCSPGSSEWVSYWDNYYENHKLYDLRMERYIKYMRDYI